MLRSLRAGLWRAVAFVAAASMAATAIAADDNPNWPQWRGPHGTGVADGKPPVEWSETKNVKWKVSLPGKGTATPIAWENYIFIQAAIPTGKKPEPEAAPDAKPGDKPADKPKDDKPADKKPSDGKPADAKPINAAVNLQQPQPPADPPRQEGGERGPRGEGRGPGRGPGGFGRGQKPTEIYQMVVLCLDRKTGKTLWQTTVKEELPHEGHHRDHSYASHSPVTDGKHLICYFGSRGLYCLDLTGKVLWSKDLGKMRTAAGFGEGSSPALSGNTVVVNWDHEGEDFIVAFDKVSGNELWRQKRDESTTWATPIIVEHAGRKQVVTVASRRVRGYDFESGAPLWECAGLTSNVIPTPIAANDMVYAMSGFRGSSLLAIRLGKTGDLTGSDSIVWKHDRSTPYVPSPLLYGNRLYFCSSNNAIVSCFDVTTGKSLFSQERLNGPNGVYASLVGAADHVYVVGRNGTTAVLKNADKPEIVATNKLDERIDASPAISGNELYLRSDRSLYCITEAAQ